MKIVFWALAVWLITRVFIFQTFHIHTNSMHQTLVEGDYIFVNKLAYGARMPVTPLSVSFGNRHLFLDWIQLPYLRIPGFSTVKRNDILVFNFPGDDALPTDQREQYIKRCIAAAGDTVSIVQGKVLVNGKEVLEYENVLKNYRVTFEGGQIDRAILKLINAEDQKHGFSGNNLTVSLTEKMADSIRHLQHVVSVETQSLQSGYSTHIFPNTSKVKWGIDNFGPLFIPKCGQQIYLNSSNLIFYKKIIEKYENNTVETRNDSTYINGEYSPFYTFKMDYYFTLGDNRNNSIDSRFWGFVPESHLIGKATGTLFSSRK
ncbi:MAG: signal peptidase I [Bacteroidota bacterium]